MSLSVTRNHRLTFTIDEESEICDLNLEDYHWQEEYRTMPMKNPPHPGDFIRTEIIEPAGLSVTAAAAALRVSRPALSSLLNNKADLSGEMALRIEKAFGVEMETLMRMQSAFDIAKTRSREKEIPRAVLSSPRRGPPVDPCFAKVCSGDEGGMHVSAVRPLAVVPSGVA